MSVPYKPVPTEGPSKQGTPYLRVPGGVEEASGVGVAKAVQGFGKELERTGDMLERQVVTVQNMQNDTDAKNGDVKALIEMGELQSQFDSLEGDNRVKALPQHLQKIEEIRQKHLDSMPNPRARQMLDSILTTRVGHLIVDSGHKAGTAAKQAAHVATASRKDTAIATFDSTNTESTEDSINTIKASVVEQAMQNGFGADWIESETRKAMSKAFLNDFTKNAMKYPELYSKKLDTIKGHVDDAGTISTLQKLVDTAMASKQTFTDSLEILDKMKFDPSKGPGQTAAIMEETRKYAERKGKDNPQYEWYLTHRVESRVASGLKEYRDTQEGNQLSIGNYILELNDKNMPVSIDAINGPKAPPEIKEAYKILDKKHQDVVRRWLKESMEGPVRMTDARLREYQRLRGMANDPEHAAEFVAMGVDGIMKADLPLAEKKQLLAQQAAVAKNPGIINNQVSKVLAMPGVARQLESVGITAKPGGDRDRYLQLRGAVEDQLRDHQGDKRAPMPPDEAQKMVSRLLQEQEKRWFLPNRRLFEVKNIPEADEAAIKQSFTAAGHPEPTQEQILRVYARKLYKELYDKEQKSKATGTPSPKGKTSKPDLEGLGQ